MTGHGAEDGVLRAAGEKQSAAGAMAASGPSGSGAAPKTLDAAEEARTQFASFTFGGSPKKEDSSIHIAHAPAPNMHRPEPTPSAVETPPRKLPSVFSSASTSSTSSPSPSAPTSPRRILPRPYPSPSAPQEGFTFGTCSGSSAHTHAHIAPPSSPPGPLAATPTVELGAFEYPNQITPASPTLGHRLAGGSVGSITSLGVTAGAGTSGSGSFSSSSSFSGRSGRGSFGTGGGSGSSRPTFPLGESHRRNSIISRPPLVHAGEGQGSSSSTNTTSSGYTASTIHALPGSPPATRRSSTCSTIQTLPAAGRRPSILHSVTIAESSAVPLVGSTIDGAVSSSSSSSSIDAHTLHPQPTSAPATAPSWETIRNTRRTSLMFQPKTLPAPIPPSLLARRGSLPVNKLFDSQFPSSNPYSHAQSPRTRGSISTSTSASASAGSPREHFRASFSGMQTYGTVNSVTSHRLYHRRESLMTTVSSGSGADSDKTVGAGSGTGSAGASGTRGEWDDGASEGSGRTSIALGPGLMAVPHPNPTEGQMTGLGIRRSSVPQSLRSTVRSPSANIQRPTVSSTASTTASSHRISLSGEVDAGLGNDPYVSQWRARQSQSYGHGQGHGQGYGYASRTHSYSQQDDSLGNTNHPGVEAGAGLARSSRYSYSGQSRPGLGERTLSSSEESDELELGGTSDLDDNAQGAGSKSKEMRRRKSPTTGPRPVQAAQAVQAGDGSNELQRQRRAQEGEIHYTNTNEDDLDDENDEPDNDVETDEVESLPTPGLEVLVAGPLDHTHSHQHQHATGDAKSLLADPFADERQRQAIPMIHGDGGEDVRGPHDIERPTLDSLDSDQTVKLTVEVGRE